MPYIEGAGASTERARRVLSLITFVSILVFVSYWNVFAGFAEERERAYEVAHMWLDEAGFVSGQCVEGRPRVEAARCAVAKKVIDRIAGERGITAAEYNFRKELLIGYLEQDLEQLRERDAFSVPFPFAGVPIDIGDLGLLAGLSTVVLLLWLAYAIHAEMRDVKRAFEVARPMNEVEYAYDLLMMKQVLTVPDAAPTRAHRMFASVPKVFLVFPLFAQTFGIIVHFMYRFQTLGLSSVRAVLTAVVVPVVLWCLALGLTVLVFRLEREYGGVWTRTRASFSNTNPSGRP